LWQDEPISAASAKVALGSSPEGHVAVAQGPVTARFCSSRVSLCGCCRRVGSRRGKRLRNIWLGRRLTVVEIVTPLATARSSVRQFRQPPTALWRRSVGAPRFNYPRYPEHFELWQRFEMRLRALPDPHGLARWYRWLRAGWWTRFALARFLADAADGAIVAYQPDGSDAPASFFESDVDLDPEGPIFCRRDRRIPLLAHLRFYRADDPPAAAIALRAARLANGMKGALTQRARRAQPAAPAQAAA
jgi:hypothetical protein